MNNKSINRNRNRKKIVKHITQVVQLLPPHYLYYFTVAVL